MRRLPDQDHHQARHRPQHRAGNGRVRHPRPDPRPHHSPRPHLRLPLVHPPRPGLRHRPHHRLRPPRRHRRPTPTRTHRHPQPGRALSVPPPPQDPHRRGATRRSRPGSSSGPAPTATTTDATPPAPAHSTHPVSRQAPRRLPRPTTRSIRPNEIDPAPHPATQPSAGPQARPHSDDWSTSGRSLRASAEDDQRFDVVLREAVVGDRSDLGAVQRDVTDDRGHECGVGRVTAGRDAHQ